MTDCKHDDLDVHLSFEAYDETNVVMARLVIRCARCGHFMRFPGLDDAHSFTRPTAHDIGRALSLPMVPENEAMRLPFTVEGTARAS